MYYWNHKELKVVHTCFVLGIPCLCISQFHSISLSLNGSPFQFYLLKISFLRDSVIQSMKLYKIVII